MTTATEATIRPFEVHVPEEDLVDIRRRIAATRWPSKELVADRSQGVQLATLQEVARYWADGYDWRKCEAKLNALPQFTTEIDGVQIHFIHVRSKHEDALPLIMTHGWPGSVIELPGLNATVSTAFWGAVPIAQAARSSPRPMPMGPPGCRELPRRSATTGVPQVMASIMMRPNGS
jgi:hypothetical protein